MKFLVFGDANLDLTVERNLVFSRLKELSHESQFLILEADKLMEKIGGDVEYYLHSKNQELSHFFHSLRPRVEPGGCGVIKSKTMALSGHNVLFYSWVGEDNGGRRILNSLSASGVDTGSVLELGDTCETFNIFSSTTPRLALSYWESKRDVAEFLDFVDKIQPDAVFLTGAHRIKSPLGYSNIAKRITSYVFTGSFASYTQKQIRKKYEADFSSGVLVGNETEMMQLAGAQTPLSALKKLHNDVVVMHGPDRTFVRLGREIISTPTEQISKNQVKELTGIGDVWEAVFISSVGDIKTATREQIISAMRAANRAATLRMLHGGYPRKWHNP